MQGCSDIGNRHHINMLYKMVWLNYNMYESGEKDNPNNWRMDPLGTHFCLECK